MARSFNFRLPLPIPLSSANLCGFFSAAFCSLLPSSFLYNYLLALSVYSSYFPSLTLFIPSRCLLVLASPASLNGPHYSITSLLSPQFLSLFSGLSSLSSLLFLPSFPSLLNAPFPSPVPYALHSLRVISFLPSLSSLLNAPISLSSLLSLPSLSSLRLLLSLPRDGARHMRLTPQSRRRRNGFYYF